MEPKLREGIQVAGEGRELSVTAGPGKPERRGKFPLDWFDPEEAWKPLLDSGDDRIRIAAVKYLTDQKYGRAASAAKASGEKQHKITLVVDL